MSVYRICEGKDNGIYRGGAGGGILGRWGGTGGGFSDFQIFRTWILVLFVCKVFGGNMLVRYRGMNNKGVLDRPWTKWRVLRAISSTLKCQFTGKCWKVDFLMPFKTRSCQSSTEYLCIVRALPRTRLDLPNFNLNYQKTNCCEKLDFSSFSQFDIRQCPTSMKEYD